MRIAIVNDLAVACEALRRVVTSDPSLTIAWIARDGAQAVEMAAKDVPDLILMDLIMPRMDGVEATRKIMRASPCPILVVTATVSGNAALVYEALGAGALDAVNTPTLGTQGALTGATELLRRLHLVERVGRHDASSVANTSTNTSTSTNASTNASTNTNIGASVNARVPSLAAAKPRSTTPTTVPTTASSTTPISSNLPENKALSPIIAIGASTGGPRALAAVLRALPLDLDASVLVVQHVSVEFVAGFAAWLGSEIARPVELARRGVVPRAGQILVAGEDRHMIMNARGALEFRDEPLTLTHRPSVDELFTSLATHARPGIALLLTGMGRDGAEGLLTLRRAGWHTIAQDEASSIVWGMPGAAHRLGGASETLALDVIGSAISKRMGRAPRSETRINKEQSP